MLETARLILKPLNYQQLVKYLQADGSLENELGLNTTSRSISPELKEAFEQTILPNVADETKNYLYCTLWTIISRADNKMVADLCIVGEPNEAGEIEIGYGTYEAFRKNGYMTEAVGAIIDWARSQPKVSSIVAGTHKDNADSYSILLKNNFVKIGETDGLLHWKLNF